MDAWLFVRLIFFARVATDAQSAIPSLRRLGATCHRRSMINYIYHYIATWPVKILPFFKASFDCHGMISINHQKLGPVWQVHATCPRRSQADVMPLWHCVRENFSELLKIRSFSVKNCTNDQEKQEQTRSNSHLPVGNVSNQYKGNTEKKKKPSNSLDGGVGSIPSWRKKS